MTSFEDRVQAEIDAKHKESSRYNAEQRAKREAECIERYTEFFGEPPVLTREVIEGRRQLIASGHGFRFAWAIVSNSSSYGLHLVRTCEACGSEYVDTGRSGDYLYVIAGDIERAGSMEAAVVKRLAGMLSGYIPEHKCEERARLAAKGGVRNAAAILGVSPYEIVTKLNHEWRVD